MRSVVSAISMTPLGLDVLYEFMSININKTMDQLPNGEDIITFIYSTLASKMTDDEDIEKVSLENHKKILYNKHKSQNIMHHT